MFLALPLCCSLLCAEIISPPLPPCFLKKYYAAGLQGRAALVGTHRQAQVSPACACRAAGVWEPGGRAGGARFQCLRQPPRAKPKSHRHVLGGNGNVSQGKLRPHPRVRVYPHDRRQGYPCMHVFRRGLPSGTLTWWGLKPRLTSCTNPAAPTTY